MRGMRRKDGNYDAMLLTPRQKCQFDVWGVSICDKEAIVPSIPCFSLKKPIKNLLQPLPFNLMVGPAVFCAHKASIKLPRVNSINPGILYIPSFAWIYKKRGQRGPILAVTCKQSYPCTIAILRWAYKFTLFLRPPIKYPLSPLDTAK